jgi:hypothetical protein
MTGGEERYCDHCQEWVICPVDDFSCQSCGATTSSSDTTWCHADDCDQEVERTLDGRCPKCRAKIDEPIEPTHYCPGCKRWVFPAPDATPDAEECPQCGALLTDEEPDEEE